MIPAQPRRHTLRWEDLAACAGKDPDLFFPDTADQATIAQRICRQCPVKTQCAALANQLHATTGVWAGHYRTSRHPDGTNASDQTDRKPTRRPPRKEPTA